MRLVPVKSGLCNSRAAVACSAGVSRVAFGTPIRPSGLSLIFDMLVIGVTPLSAGYPSLAVAIGRPPDEGGGATSVGPLGNVSVFCNQSPLDAGKTIVWSGSGPLFGKIVLSGNG